MPQVIYNNKASNNKEKKRDLAQFLSLLFDVNKCLIFAGT